MNGFPSNPRLLNVIQGEFEICHSKDIVLSTILGSCVAVCMYDPVQNVGGLNHYLLPHDGTSGPQEKKIWRNGDGAFDQWLAEKRR